ncbi:MAG: phage integrase family protein [Clostridiales bacterium]|nr:phage integrase family protein [Clostridiales bacterium]
MNNVLDIRSLESYTNATERQKERIDCKQCYIYDFDQVLDKEIRKALTKFVEERCSRLSIVTIGYEIWLYDIVCAFFNTLNANLSSLKREYVERKYKAFLMSKGYPLTKAHFRKYSGKLCVEQSETLAYMHKFLDGIYIADETDIIYITEFEGIRNNPIKPVRYINFEKIKQEKMKQETKAAIRMESRYKAASTLRGEVLAVNRFSKFMDEKYQDIKSFKNVNRKVIEDYLIYIKVELRISAVSYKSEISQLKSVINEAASIFEYEALDNLFFGNEYSSMVNKIQRFYSQDELERFNKCLIREEEQFARCIFLHQILGTRISETLLLRKDCIYYKNKMPVIKIEQWKTKKYYEKPINDEIVTLINKCIEYTEKRYGVTEYIFVSPKDPKRPLSYGTLETRIKTMIRDNIILDDNGELLFFSTHVFRRNYGKALTEMHLDDVRISKLLGHADTRNVYKYRKLSPTIIARETRPVRDMMDKTIREISAGWF